MKEFILPIIAIIVLLFITCWGIPTLSSNRYCNMALVYVEKYPQLQERYDFFMVDNHMDEDEFAAIKIIATRLFNDEVDE